MKVAVIAFYVTLCMVFRSKRPQLVQTDVEGRKPPLRLLDNFDGRQKGLARSSKFSLSPAGPSLQYQTHNWHRNSEKSQSQSFNVAIESFATV
jgi:hypothetical protein